MPTIPVGRSAFTREAEAAGNLNGIRSWDFDEREVGNDGPEDQQLIDLEQRPGARSDVESIESANAGSRACT